MADMTIKEHRSNLDILLKIQSQTEKDTPLGSHLLKAAIVSLIENADLTRWEKNHEELSAHEFFALVLGAIARRYNASLREPMDDVATHTILQDLIDELQAEDYI